MFTPPIERPVTTPLVPTDAKLLALLVQTPPGNVTVSGVVEPAQMVDAPVIDDGTGVIDIVPVVKQPVGNVYVILSRPADTPVTTPVDGSIVATPVAKLDQLPPAVESYKVVV